MSIDLSTLPADIKRQIPLSIRTYKSVYELNELPVRIQTLIKKYQDVIPDITYTTVFDLKPNISEYSDFKTITNKVDLVLEYLKTYLQVVPKSYPFDPVFGCKLKNQLQTRDTELRKTLVSAEIDKIINVMRHDLDTKIKVLSMKMNKSENLDATEYYITLDLQIDDEKKIFKIMMMS